ncbi:MAG: hypothetical protein IJL62_06035 [Clostridia bacterium]|nr:hypothetical protein [Clostridia bacterium]
MEQYNNPVIIEQPAAAPVPVGLQITALIMGVIDFVLSFLCYFAAIFGNVMRFALNYDHASDHGIGIGIVVFAAITLAIAVVVIILGVIGLVRSIRRPRTVKGIVLSAIGLSFGCGGAVLSVICLFLNGILSIVLNSMH